MGVNKIEDQKWTTIIKPRTGWFDVNLVDWWMYRDLILLFVKRNFTTTYKQTLLGPAWAIIQPLLTTIIFTVVFGNIAKLPTDGISPFIFYLCGNLIWGFFSSCLIATSNTFISNAGIFGKVYFPRLTVPISIVLTNFITFIIQLLFFLCFWIYFSLKPGSTIITNNWLIIIPILLIETSLLGLGFGLIISALTTKYRDLTMLVSFGIQLWMYATPIAYPISLIPQKWVGIYMLNPMASIIVAFRYAFFGSGEFQLYYLVQSFIFSILIVFFSIILFSKVEKTFMDTV